MGNWKRISSIPPPENRVVKTKISDDIGERNEQNLIFKDGRWWTADLAMYVYYIPTHWLQV